MKQSLFALLLLVLTAQPSQARLAQKSDLAIWPEFDHITIEIEKDGRYTYTQEYQFEVLNDRGRETESLQSIPYDDRASVMHLLAARVITDGQSVDVGEKNIETRESGENTQAFDTQKQLVISFPNVHNGSHIYLKYKLEFKEVPFPNRWGWSMHYNDVDLPELKVHISSKIPLHTWKQDTAGTLKVDTVTKDGLTTVDIKNTKPLMQVVTQEDFPYVDPSNALAVVISSDTEWSGFASDTVGEYEKLLSAALPPGLEKIRKGAGVLPEKPTSDQVLEVLNKVSAMIAERYRYFGDWRRRNGGQIPRALNEIDETTYGDCKDLALATTAVYRALGLKANVAWIFRGEQPVVPALYKMPVESAFNHAIVRVVFGDKTYWVDATNPVAYAKGIPLDISDRPAFILDAKKSVLDHTPPLRSQDNIYDSDFNYRLEKDKSVEVLGLLKFRGRAATNLIIRNFYDSVETVNYDLIRSITGADRVLSFDVGDFDRTSRVVRDLEINVKYKLADIGLRTTSGYGVTLNRSDVIDRLLVNPKDRESDVYLTAPALTKMQILIRSVQKVGGVSMDCDLQNRWVHLQRRVRGSRSGIEVRDQYEVKEDRVLKSDLISPEFVSFQAKVRDCFFNSALILK